MKSHTPEPPWWIDWLFAFLGAVGVVVTLFTGYAMFMGIRGFLRTALAQHPGILGTTPDNPVGDGYRPLLQRWPYVGYGMAHATGLPSSR